MLVEAAQSILAVPLAVRIHEGLAGSNRDRRTLLDKMHALLDIVAIPDPYYFVANAFYAAGKVVRGLLREDNHLVTRVRSIAVAYTLYRHRSPKKRGRPRLCEEKVKLRSLLNHAVCYQQAPSPVYGEHNVTIRYHVCNLLWRPAAQLVRFVAVVHPNRGSRLLMCTDVSLNSIEIIRLYGLDGLRFKIKHSFKQAVRTIGSFAYHFCMKDMKPLRRRNGNQHLHRESLRYREAVKRKVHAYHVFMKAGVVAQGLLQYLAIAFPTRVWRSFGPWLRTIRPGILRSEFVVASALTPLPARIFPEFRRESYPGKIHHRTAGP